MLEDTYLTQLITYSTQENILDLVFVTDPDFVHEGRVGEKLNSCDHHLIRFSTRTDHDLLENVSKIPNLRKANLNLALELLFHSTWEALNLSLVDDAWNSFRNKLQEEERTTVPMKNRRTDNGVN